MPEFGISVYPEREKQEETYAYLKMAGEYGFKRVFTCLLSVKEDREEIIETFTQFCDKAHESGLRVSVDTNPEVFKKLEASPLDLKVFKQMGVDIIRLDGHFSQMEDVEITKNPYNIKIEYNASSTINLDYMINRYGANRHNMCICSNFYPQRYTGMGLNRFKELNELYKPLGLNNAAFVSSNEKDTHGPWEVYEGLCTLEIHRGLPIDVQARHLIALGYNDDILVGNAFASKEELETLSHINPNKLTMKVDIEEISEAERKIIEYPYHSQRDDCNELLVRSSMPRVIFKNESIERRRNNHQKYHKGDVLIINNELKHYMGELIIVTSEIEALDYYNYVGHLNDAEQLILDCIKPGGSFVLEVRNG